MSGEIAPVVGRSWKEIWLPLSRARHAPSDLFNELVRGLCDEPQPPEPPFAPPPEAFDNNGELIDSDHIAARANYQQAIALHADERSAYEVAVSGGDARPLFKKLLQRASASESAAIAFIEGADEVLDAYGDVFRQHYRRLTLAFLGNHNLGYAVDGEFRLHTSMPAIFSRLMQEVREKSAINPHTQQMFAEFEEAMFDLRHGRTEVRLKACLSRQFHLLEALGRQCPNVNGHTLGEICNQLPWPHVSIRDVARRLSGFRNDFPGIAHAGNPAAHHLTVKDYVSISLMLASISPYFVADLDGDRCYGG